MKSARYRRVRRRTASVKGDGPFFKKEVAESFFAPHPSPISSPAHADALQRKCESCEEDEKVSRQPEVKEEEKVMKVEEKKEEEKVMKTEDKKEEEKLMKAEDKKEEEKVMKAEDKQEEEKVMKAEEKKEEEKVMKAEEKKEEEVQKKEVAPNSGAPSAVANYVGTLGNKGNPMPNDVNAFYSSRMGYDFSDVKIHTDKEAVESAQDANAKAYAIGNHVVFNEGQYNMESSDGRKLMAHELTHVVQQNGAREILQRIACEGSPKAPPKAGQKGKNPIDTRAQAIIDLASGSEATDKKAVAIVTQIICQYYPGDAALVDSVVYKSTLSGLDVTSKGSKEKTTGSIGVGDTFVKGTTTAHFARRVLQVGHEIEHIKQYRGGMAGKDKSDQREFLAFADNALADEFEGTGRMTFSTRLTLVDAAIGLYHCLSDDLKTGYKSQLSALQARRKLLIDSGKVSKETTEPTACKRTSN